MHIYFAGPTTTKQKEEEEEEEKKKVFLCRTKSHSQTRRNYISTRSGKRSGTSGV